MKYYIGSSYYPPHHDPKDWERDIVAMAAAGHNTIRTAELLASWDMIEQEPRQPDFSWLERTFQLAQANGIGILLGSGACNPPYWLLREHPDLAIVSRDNVSYPPGGMWGWACINHPAYIEESDRYLRQLIEHFGSSAALIGWQIHNEPGYPFIPRQNQPPDWYDYNPHTIARFREWLQHKYVTIGALIEAWRSDPSNLRPRSFDEVFAPRILPSEWGIVCAWLDWREFTTDNWRELTLRQHNLIKSLDTEHPTSINLYGEATDFDGRLGVDPWKLAEVVDAIGFDFYPGLKERGAPERGRLPAGPSFGSWFLDFGRSVAQWNGKRFWLNEMESGPLDGWIKGPRYTTTAADIRRWGLQALAHGSEMILYQGYREWNCIPIHWGALVDLNGKPTERYYAAKELAEMVHANTRLLADLRPTPARVALWYDHANQLACGAMNAADFAKQSLTGIYEMLWRNNFNVDFVTPHHLERSNYDVIILPFAIRITRAAADLLAKAVERGAMLIGFAKCAMLDERGWYWNDRPGAGLDALFGVREQSIEVTDPQIYHIELDSHRYKLTSFHHRQSLQLASDTEVIGRWSDDAPAVTRRRHGKGCAIYFGTHCDRNVADDAENEQALAALLTSHSVHPPFYIHPGTSQLDVHLLENKTRSGDFLLIICNESYESIDTVVYLPNCRINRVADLFGHKVTLQTSNDDQQVSISLAPRDSTAIVCHRK